MQGTKSILLNEYLLVFMFCMAVITGPAIAILFENDLLHFPDSRSYIGLAHFDLTQTPVHRYRVIVPFAAAAINAVFGKLFAGLAPAHFSGDYSLAFSFLLVNTMLMAYFGLLIYRYCMAFGVGRLSAVVGMLVMLTCRYTMYTAALPLVDSLFCVVVAMSLLGIKEKNTAMLICALFLGPFAKEAFLFIAPLIFFFSHIDKKKAAFLFLVSGAVVFTFRYLLDRFAPVPANMGLSADADFLPNLIRNLPKLLSIHTLFNILMNTGLWLFVPLLTMFVIPGNGKGTVLTLDKYLVWFLFSVILQMLLSGSMERMFYLAMPVLCAVVALSVEELRGVYHKIDDKLLK